MTQSACVIRQLSLEIEHHLIFKDLDFQLSLKQSSALIGRNGQGKSLLLRLLTQQKQQYPNWINRGEIQWHCPSAYLPQLNRLSGQTIADALDITELALCFQRIQHGDARADDFALVDGFWDVPQQWQFMLEAAGLPNDLQFKLEHLSEGQKTKLALCRLFQRKDHYLLLDEPSNHLDHSSRLWLIQQIKQHPTGCLVVSHDRELLQQMQQIYQLNEYGLQQYQGNYADYQQQHQTQVHALQHRVEQDKRDVKQTKQQQHATLMKAEKRKQAGNKILRSGSQAKILLDFKKEQAQQSASSLTKQLAKQLRQSTQNLQDHQQQLEKVKAQRFELQFTTAVQQGEILRLNQVLLPHLHTEPIHFALTAGEKIQLSGANGVGKSSLLQLIQQRALPAQGELYLGVNTLYLDQNFSLLRQDQNAIENLIRLAPERSAVEYRNQLGQLRLRGDKALLPLHCLSGGEQLKVALLAISQLSAKIQLLLLDEPENHLDIESRSLLAQAILAYPGSVILVSHDASFVAECGIEQCYTLQPASAAG